MFRTDRIWVQGLSFNSILNLNASDSIHQCTSSALSIGNLSMLKSKPLILFPLYSTSSSVADELCEVNPPFAQISETAYMSSIASFSVGTDFSASSAQTFFFSASAVLAPNSLLPSSAVHFTANLEYPGDEPAPNRCTLMQCS